MAEKNKKLRALIFGMYDNEAQFAKTISWSKQKLSKIANGNKEPDVLEVKELADGLHVSIEKMVNIFLPEASPNGQHVNAN